MSSYRYVVFPRGQQPAAEEVRGLQTFAVPLVGRFTWGKTRDDGRLALAFDRDTLLHVLRIDPGLGKLLDRWQARGCELVDHLAFIKDAAALRPLREPHPPIASAAATERPAIHGEQRDVKHPGSADQLLAARQRAAQESMARAKLSVHRALGQFAAVERAAAAIPYALMALAAVATIALGFHLRDRLLNSGREARTETIERLATDHAK